jgi:hypothetical protein
MSKIIEKIKTFEDACKTLNFNPETVIPDFSIFPELYQKALIAHAKLILIAQALNEGWQPDWSNWDEYKYYPWFDMEYSASGCFSCYVCDLWTAGSNAGSRLCFKSRELAEYAGKQFKELYEDYFVIKK